MEKHHEKISRENSKKDHQTPSKNEKQQQKCFEKTRTTTHSVEKTVDITKITLKNQDVA
jgi:hypothetical protein